MPRERQRRGDLLDRTPLADLHNHLGGAASPAVLWRLAHEQGIKLPVKSYWKFEELVTVHGKLKGMLALDRDKFYWTELIQSSPLAMEPVVNRTLGGAYRGSNIVLHEVRYNPMKRNRGGERDLDYIILATIRGLEKALLEYPEVKAGLILMLDREFPLRLNDIIYQKAIKYQSRGIIGLDVAGPQSKKFKMRDYADLFLDAKRRGFGVTIHTGEEGSLEEMRYVVDAIVPHRIGHGVMAYRDRRLMGALRERGITLELCPTSNLNIGIVKSTAERRRVYRTLYEAGVKLTVNTDGAELHRTTLKRELELLVRERIFTPREVRGIIGNAFAATFITNGKL